MEIFIDDRCHANLDGKVIHLLEQVVEVTVDLEKFPLNFEVSISLVTPDEIRELNNQYRGKDEVTDVLSFPMFEEGDPEPVQLGDLVLCYERAQEQSRSYEHTLTRELCFLTAHGMLHLLGYDHMEEEDRQVMQEKEKEIMQRMQISR